MPFRHDLMLTGGNHTRLVEIATARGIERDEVLCEALRAYLADSSLFTISIPLPVDGARTYINCALPDDLRAELNDKAELHKAKPFGHQDHRTVFTRAVQHYFNQLAQAPVQDVAVVDVPAPVEIPTRYDRWRTQFAKPSPKFKL